VRAMLWGLVGSLPMVTAMLALSGEPPPVGVNFTAIVQLESDAASPISRDRTPIDRSLFCESPNIPEVRIG
jgi:hypothetical protein